MAKDPLGKINVNVGKAQSWLDMLKSILAMIGLMKKPSI
jgi:hypothetical protein